jgi:hypothetical protein
MTFFPQQIFDTAQLTQLITRTPKFEAHDTAVAFFFYDQDARVEFSQALEGVLELGITCEQRNLQLSSLAQLCSSSFFREFVSMVDTLHIHEDEFLPLDWPDYIHFSEWLELLDTFTVVRVFLISQLLAPCILPAVEGTRVYLEA